MNGGKGIPDSEEQAMRTHWHDWENRVSIPAHEPDLPKWAWCLVANIRKEGFLDAGPLDSRGGTKH